MKKVKKLIIIIFTISMFISLICLPISIIYKNNKETQYCGNVVNIYMTQAGYKVSQTRHVVFYCDSLKRNVDVRVTNQQYANTIIGQRICFDLNKMQLEE